MSSFAKPNRRALVKCALASAGLPIISQALGSAAEGKARPEDNGERGGTTVSVGSGIQMYYKEDWLGAPWLSPEPALFLHGNLETSEIWYGWVPRMASTFG